MLRNTMARATLAEIERVAGGLEGARGIKRDDNTVTFQFTDRDGDTVSAYVSLVNETRVIAAMLLAVPSSFLVTAMIVSNRYNGLKDSHGTFAYAVPYDDDRSFIVLETHLSVTGGVTRTNIASQLQTFIGRIDSFEHIMIGGIRELGPDSSFLKGNSSRQMWEALGHVLGGVLKSYSSARFANM